MKLKSVSRRSGRPEQPFHSFEVAISTLERAARNGEDPSARSKAAARLILKTRELAARVKGNPDAQDRFDVARFALERVASAQDPAVRRQAFEAFDWNVVTLKSFTHSQFLDIRRMAREKLGSATRNSELLKEPEELRPAGSKNYQLGTWRF